MSTLRFSGKNGVERKHKPIRSVETETNKTMKYILSILAGVTAGITVCQGEMVPKLNEEMMKQAHGVFVGTVQKVTSEEKDGEVFEGGKEVITTYTSKILITEVKKGKDLKVGQEIEVQTMQLRWVGEGTPPPGHSGHPLKPKKGQEVLVFFELLKDGTKFAIFQDGMQLAKKEKG